MLLKDTVKLQQNVIDNTIGRLGTTTNYSGSVIGDNSGPHKGNKFYYRPNKYFIAYQL